MQQAGPSLRSDLCRSQKPVEIGSIDIEVRISIHFKSVNSAISQPIEVESIIMMF